MTTEITLSNGKTVKLTPVKSTKEVLKQSGIKSTSRIDKLLLVILDQSGSMGGFMDIGSKIEVAWEILQKELAPNMAGWTYGVLMFSDQPSWEVYPCQDTQALIATSTPRPIGGTALRRALDFSWSWVSASVKEARFVLLSDGEPTDDSKDNIIRLANEHSSIPIDTVGIGSNTRIFEYDPVFLKELSRVTGGTFVEAHSAKMLATTILKLSPSQRPLLGTVTKEN